ncbi:response regulator, partial [Longimicrobium sp.]|uniref:response regulator n=1 Tax=Longimicrobium sp. TaxID=2029185 RepID=UPI002E309CBA
VEARVSDDRRKRLLVVEDSPMMVRMYRMVLGPRYDVTFAADGVEGLDAAARDPDVDGMVVDINMPGMDGLEFIRRLRGELGMTGVPVLVCSTEADEADRASAREAGANGFLPKPWQPAELLAALQERLGGA